LDGKLDLVLKANLGELDCAITATEEFCKEVGATTRVAFLFSLALDELLTNLVSYGHPEGGEHEVRLSLRVEGERLVGEFVDSGRPFNPLEQAAPADVDASVSDRRIGGQGIHLIRTLMEGVAYDHRDGQNHLRFWTRLGAE
jgi:anti-sigma regulatory factor (Ser/Thr protein kinase)